jgi:quercetin dioxygenase-like cupin family protein
MHIKNIFESTDAVKLTKMPLLENHARQLVKLQIPAGQTLKQHVSKVDALVMVVSGTADFILWEGESKNVYDIGPNDIVAFKADQLHAVEAKTDFSAFVIK